VSENTRSGTVASAVDGASQPDAGQTRLARASLTITDAIAISVSLLAPGLAMFLNVAGVAVVAGASTPLAFLLGGVACLALAFVVVGFTRRMASAGYAYSYTSRSLGKSAGFLAGWLYAFGFVCFTPMLMAAAAYLLINLLGIGQGWWFPIFVIGMALLVVLSVVRVKVTTRVQIAVAVITVVLILIVDAVVTVKGGAGGHSQSLQPFTFGHTLKGGFSGVFYGIILGITSYIGFETAADFGEETANSRRAVPIAITATVGFAILLYVWTTYSLDIGYGTRDGGKAFAADPTALKTIATSYVGPWLGDALEIGALCATFFACVGCAIAVSRTLFSMGREGVLPRWLGKTHPRFHTPANATIVVAALATALAAIVGFGMAQDAFGGAAFTVFYFFATLGTLAVIVVYIGLCFGGAVFFKRVHQRYRVALHLLIPVVGAGLFAAALYGSLYPVPAFPLNLTPYLVLAWLVVGVVTISVIRARNPQAIERIGSILGEEGGDLAAELDLAAPQNAGSET
jgi:amino acid transporter